MLWSLFTGFVPGLTLEELGMMGNPTTMESTKPAPLLFLLLVLATVGPLYSRPDVLAFRYEVAFSLGSPSSVSLDWLQGLFSTQ